MHFSRVFLPSSFFVFWTFRTVPKLNSRIFGVSYVTNKGGGGGVQKNKVSDIKVVSGETRVSSTLFEFLE